MTARLSPEDDGCLGNHPYHRRASRAKRSRLLKVSFLLNTWGFASSQLISKRFGKGKVFVPVQHASISSDSCRALFAMIDGRQTFHLDIQGAEKRNSNRSLVKIDWTRTGNIWAIPLYACFPSGLDAFVDFVNHHQYLSLTSRTILKIIAFIFLLKKYLQLHTDMLNVACVAGARREREWDARESSHALHFPSRDWLRSRAPV